MRQGFLSNTNSSVANLDFKMAVFKVTGSDTDGAAFRGKLDGISDQVGDHLLKAIRIKICPKFVRLDFYGQVQFFHLRQRFKRLCIDFYKLHNICPAELQLQFSRFDFGEVKQLVD